MTQYDLLNSSLLSLIQRADQQALIEVELDRVQRWTNFHASSDSRRQTTLAHTAGMSLLCPQVIAAVRAHQNTRTFDPYFVQCAISYHDVGEKIFAQSGKDILYHDKTGGSHQQELDAFHAFISDLPERVRLELLNYYLLQHIGRTDFSPQDAVSRDILQKLRVERSEEYHVFDAIERLDYLLYALHELSTKKNLRIVVHVLRGQHLKLRASAQRFPGFRETFYTDAFVEWAEEILSRTRTISEIDIPDRP